MWTMAGQPDLYRIGRRHGRAGAIGLIVDRQRRGVRVAHLGGRRRPSGR